MMIADCRLSWRAAGVLVNRAEGEEGDSFGENAPIANRQSAIVNGLYRGGMVSMTVSPGETGISWL